MEWTELERMFLNRSRKRLAEEIRKCEQDIERINRANIFSLRIRRQNHKNHSLAPTACPSATPVDA